MNCQVWNSEFRIPGMPRPEGRTELLLGYLHSTFCKIFSVFSPSRSSQFQFATHWKMLGTLSFLFASTLAILRAWAKLVLSSVHSSSQCGIVSFALWEQKKVIVAIGSTLWLANVTSYIYSLHLSPYQKWSFWNRLPGLSTSHGHQVGVFCEIVHGSRFSALLLSTFITDFSILVLMVAGVLRWHNIRGSGGIWHLLYTQVISQAAHCRSSDLTHTNH